MNKTAYIKQLTRTIFLIFFLLMTACNQGDVEKSNEKEKIFTAVGKIVQIDMSNKKVKIDHGNIKGFMESMEMWFELHDSNIIQKVKKLRKGETVQFTIGRRGWDPAVILAIEHTHSNIQEHTFPTNR